MTGRLVQLEVQVPGADSAAVRAASGEVPVPPIASDWRKGDIDLGIFWLRTQFCSGLNTLPAPSQQSVVPSNKRHAFKPRVLFKFPSGSSSDVSGVDVRTPGSLKFHIDHP